MSTVPTSGVSVQVSLLAPVMVMLTSVGRARHNRATPGSPTRAARADDGPKLSTLREPKLRDEYEPDLLVAPWADSRPRTLRGWNPLSSHPGAKVKWCSRRIVWSDGGATDPAQWHVRLAVVDRVLARDVDR